MTGQPQTLGTICEMQLRQLLKRLDEATDSLALVQPDEPNEARILWAVEGALVEASERVVEVLDEVREGNPCP
jgi:hypothetical protein